MPIDITDKQTEILAELVDPAKLIAQDPRYEQTFKWLAEMQKVTDEAAVNRYGTRVAGGTGGMKVIARVPLRVLQGLLAVEPDLIRQGRRLEKLLRKKKIYKAYTEGSKL